MEAGSLTGYGDTDDAIKGSRRVLVPIYVNTVFRPINLTGKYNIRS